MSHDTEATPAELEKPSGDNLTGDVVEAGIKRNKAEFQEDLRWWFRYAHERKFTQSECALQLGVDPGTYSRVMRGEYKNGEGLILNPPSKMLSRIRVTIQQERDNVAEINKGRVMTATASEIHNVCRKAWKDRQIAMIFGESHIGKSEALKWFRDENNHGATLYVDLQGAGGVQDIYRAFARALKISADTPINKLMPRIYASIDRSNLVICDELHAITYAYQRRGATLMLNAIKSIFDNTGCAMVLCGTEVAREEFEIGEEKKLLKQLWRRGTIKLQLPSALRVADIRAFAKAYALPFPEAPEGNDTWKNLHAEHGDFEGLKVSEDIAYNFGILHLVSVLKDGAKIAQKARRELRWSDIIKAQNLYDQLSSKKEV